MQYYDNKDYRLNETGEKLIIFLQECLKIEK